MLQYADRDMLRTDFCATCAPYSQYIKGRVVINNEDYHAKSNWND